MTNNRQRDLAYHDLEHLEDEQALELDRRESDGERRPRFPKDDRRSSSVLTERERAERWPTG